MPEETDFDTEIDTAWSRFCGRLCRYLEAMEPGDLLTICPGGGVRRDDLSLTVMCSSTAGLRATATVEGSLALASPFDDTLALIEQGWSEHPPGDRSQRAFELGGHSSAIASALVVLIRDVRGIAHPSFLAASSVGAPVTDVFDRDRIHEDWIADGAHSQLIADVDAALESITGSVPVRDSDGDISFEIGGHIAYLRLLEADHVIDMFTVFAIHPGSCAPRSVVSELSDAWPDIKFQFSDTHVVASTRVDCAPLVEEHLGRRLGVFFRFVEKHSHEITAKLFAGAVIPLQTSALVADALRHERLADMDAATLTFAIGYESRERGVRSPMMHDAMALAAAAHLHQTRAGRNGADSDAYITHPLRNVLRLIRFGCADDVVLAAAALHDTVEDQAERIVSTLDPGAVPTRLSAVALIGHHFSPAVAAVVDAVTNPVAPQPLAVSEKNAAYREHVAAVIQDPRVFLVKLADFIDNAGSLPDLPADAKRRRLELKYSPVVDAFLDAREALGDRLGLSADGLERLDARLHRLAQMLA